MYNISNNAHCIGRLVREPQIYHNSDGSRKVRITVAAPNNYRDRDRSIGAQFLPLEHFIPARRAQDGNGVYGILHAGDLVSAAFTIRNNNYTGQDGKPVYALSLSIESIKIEEPRAVREARWQSRQSQTVPAPEKPPRSRKKAA